MAYGAILGQTPILTADGITYDNSKTSGLITGNNVQDAIDQTVGKVKDIEQLTKYGKITYVNSSSIRGNFYYPGGSNDTLTTLDIPEDIKRNSLAMIFVLDGVVQKVEGSYDTISLNFYIDNIKISEIFKVESNQSQTKFYTSMFMVKYFNSTRYYDLTYTYDLTQDTVPTHLNELKYSTNGTHTIGLNASIVTYSLTL